ncbi:MAG: S8 family serine peptidase [Chloroflexia bacterium]|nr:S8 family serine peptidase [Chloroflexia bacterium]
MPWRKCFTLLALLFLLGGGLNAVVSAQFAPDPWEKVHPRVREALGRGAKVDFLLLLREQADLRAAYRLEGKLERGRYVYQRLQDVAGHSQADLRAYLQSRGVSYRSYYIVNLIWVQDAGRDLLLELARRPEVQRVLPNPLVHGLPTSQMEPWNLPEGIEWNLSHVHAPEVWELGYTGQGAVVAGNDTGIDWDHPALIEQYRPPYPGYGRHDFNWHDAVSNQQTPYDDYGHGTHTLGTIVGDDGAGNQIGMAPGAQWIGCKNMDASGYGNPTRYIECFEFFLAPYAWNDPASADPDKAPHVINNSWGCPPSEGCITNTLEIAVDNLRAAGIEVVVSAGNYGSACSSVQDPPAIYRQSFTVGATGSSDTIANLSSRGPVPYGSATYVKPDVTAPGISVRSSVPGGGYASSSGTSMAAPHVAGLVALLISADPALAGNPDALESIITSTAEPRLDGQCGAPNPPNNVYGWGFINALGAVESVLPPSALRGTVSDVESGAPIASAALTLTHQDGTGYQAASDAGGHYSLTLQPGVYTVTASAAGYVPVTVSGVKVLSHSVTLQDFELLSAVAANPRSLQIYVPWQGRLSSTLSIDNRQAHPYELAFYEIPGGWTSPTLSAGGQVPWLEPDPLSATLPANSSLEVTIRFTATPAAGVGQPGDYFATLAANGDPELHIPVTMTVFSQCLAVDILRLSAAISGCQVSFSGELAGDPPFEQLWHFGDGLTSTAAAPTHTYTESGSYTATLEAWNCAGDAQDSDSLPLALDCTPPCVPVYGLSLAWQPLTPTAGQTIRFTARASGTAPLTYSWHFGDGTIPPAPGPGTEITHSYTLAGAYTVSLAVQNRCGQTVLRRCLQAAPRWVVYLPLLEW